jgi:hypothetical protein
MKAVNLLEKTNQLWKLNLAFVIAIIAILVLDFAEIYWGPKAYLILGVPVGVAFVMACVSIRCEICGTRWLWVAIKSRWNKDWEEWILGLEECPVCVPHSQDPPPIQRVLCPRCQQQSETSEFCDVCGKDLRPNPPPIVLPEKEERIEPIA